MRGAPICEQTLARRAWIIPADAGSTQSAHQGCQRNRDHPRGCGEHLDIEVGVDAALGSSPRMRRARLPLVHLGPSQRIIPADAGSTSPSTASPPCPADHPRGCGEHRFLYVLLTVSRGSSPRMRGARAERGGYRPADGIIPADAGSTMSILMPLTPVQDHPRGCGEHVDRIVGQREFEGSSPRMREAHRNSRSSSSTSRIIPADAGSTQCRRARAGSSWDHPRGCGEHVRLAFGV